MANANIWVDDLEQLTFAEAEYNAKKRKTRREKFLEQMDALIPWKQLERKIQQHYPKKGQGRRKRGQIYFLTKKGAIYAEAGEIDCARIAAPHSAART